MKSGLTVLILLGIINIHCVTSGAILLRNQLRGGGGGRGRERGLQNDYASEILTQ